MIVSFFIPINEIVIHIAKRGKTMDTETALSTIRNAKRIAIKIGTSTLTYKTGLFNIRRMEKIAKILSDLKNSGKDIVLVSSGAIGVGVGRLGLREKPKDTKGKQAAAAVGQCELMYLYDKMFSDYSKTIAQILLTKDVFFDADRKKNAENTFETLFDMDVIPIVNENDTISTEEIEFGDNDTLSAIVAKLTHCDLLIILSDIDGVYDKDPHQFDDAKLIDVISEITDDIESCAGGAGSNRGTGGMITKFAAAKIASECGIFTIITNGSRPEKLYDIFDGKKTGTLFLPKEGSFKK